MIPVGQEFEILIEATYWGGFSGEDSENYTTYSHEQAEPEEISVMIMFPEKKRYKYLQVIEFAQDEKNGTPVQGQTRSWPGSDNQTYYWSVTSVRPGCYYEIDWKW